MEKFKEEFAVSNVEDLELVEEFVLEGLAEDLDIDSFFEDAEETHEKKEKFEIVIKYKDEKQYKKRLNNSKKVVGYDCVSCR